MTNQDQENFQKNKKLIEYYESSLAEWDNCTHSFIACNIKKTDKSESVTQMVCQKCLMLIDFVTVARVAGEIIGYRDMKDKINAAAQNQSAEGVESST